MKVCTTVVFLQLVWLPVVKGKFMAASQGLRFSATEIASVVVALIACLGCGGSHQFSARMLTAIGELDINRNSPLVTEQTYEH